MSEANDWRSDWSDAERQLLRNALDATPEQRLAWLEEALRFAWEAGALRAEAKRTDDDQPWSSPDGP